MSANLSRIDLLKLHSSVTDKAREIMTAKNQDYAHEKDVFRNFRRYGTLGVLVRLYDKLARLDSFEENKTFAVQDEKLVDTIVDIVNYAVIYYAMKNEEKPKVEAKDGPYCSLCNQNLADYRLDTDRRFPASCYPVTYYCSNCCAEHNISTAEMTLMGTL